jgi:hypothetical protein
MTIRSNIVILAVLFCLFSAGVDGQIDTAFNDLQEEFGDFQQEINSEFQTFLSENDSLFLKFLEQSWKEYRMYELERDEKPKPLRQPVMELNQDSDDDEVELVPAKSPAHHADRTDRLPQVTAPVKYVSLAVMKSFELFGSGFNIQYHPDRIPKVRAITEKGIRDFYRSFSGQSALWNANIAMLQEKKRLYGFNDWGYYMVMQEAARQLYTRESERTLFAWFALIKSGYQVKIGYADERLYLLVPSRQELYNIPYLSDQGLKYYLFGSEVDVESEITTYSGFHTNAARIFSFSFTQLPVFENSKRINKTITYKNEAIQLTFSSGLLDYFGSMPQSALEIYYSAPLTNHSLQQLDHLLSPFLEGKSGRQKVDFLLEFIQTAIPYITDKEQFGTERYMFAEECLFFPGADCEDRTVLLKQLVEHYTALPMISLGFSNHVTLAVHFPDEQQGDHLVYNGKPYFICDPTFINAKTGMLPAELKSEQPAVLEL